jgi:hypothetical protein
VHCAYSRNVFFAGLDSVFGLIDGKDVSNS